MQSPALRVLGRPVPILLALVATTSVMAQGARPSSESASPPIDWRSAEAGILTNQTQLTFRDRFVKAGESYFSPDGRRIIFQAVEQPTDEREPDEFYAMFVADLITAAESDGAPRWQLENIRRVSPTGSANTCGWFHPIDPDRILFATTIGPPTASDPPGFQRGTSRYRWSFPPEMRIVEAKLSELPLVPLAAEAKPGDPSDIPTNLLRLLAGDGRAYVAEGSISNDGRTLLFCSLETNEGDLFVKDLESGSITPLVMAPGYDGGPFFSPTGDRICYRSDRRGNNQLQLYVADLERDAEGRVIGATTEYAVTANSDVNWCPYWHPAGEHLVYASSAVGHRNYEIFVVDARSDDGAVPPQRRYGTNPRRITFADGADVLPVFDSTGAIMMWTSQRHDDRSSQVWIADFVMPLEPRTSDPGVGRVGGEAAPANGGAAR